MFADCSVVTETQVVVASVQCSDLIQLAPIELIYNMVTSPALPQFKISEMQKLYLEQLTWQRHKESVIEDIYK